MGVYQVMSTQSELYYRDRIDIFHIFTTLGAQLYKTRHFIRSVAPREEGRKSEQKKTCSVKEIFD